MAKPRIFVSSIYYDLKHIRASLSLFIDSLGYESILFYSKKDKLPLSAMILLIFLAIERLKPQIFLY